MKATGIIRRIDDLGRIMIPKETRRMLQIHGGDGVPAHIVTIECDRLDGLEIWPTDEIVVRVDGWEIGKSDIGKTIFLTRQEAEAALRGEIHDDN